MPLALFFSLLSFPSFSDYYHQEIQTLFSELENLGEVEVQCQHHLPETSFTPQDPRPRTFHQQVHLEVTDELETAMVDGVEVSIMSVEQARRFYQQIKALDYIPTKHLADGCYARAHEVALIAENNGIRLGKAFALSENGGLLYPQNNGSSLNLPQEFVGWRYHAASFVLVREGDRLVPTVFDLGVSDVPQSFDQWRASLHRDPERVDIQVRRREHVFHDSSMSFAGTSIIESLIDQEAKIDELGYGEYLFRLEQGWL